MVDFELRRKVAEMRGFSNFKEDPEGFHGQGGRDCRLHAKAPNVPYTTCIPEWECDLDAAGDLWAEMVAAGKTLSIDDDGFCLSAILSPKVSIHIEFEQVKDPKERLARAIALIWVAWKEGKA